MSSTSSAQREAWGLVRRMSAAAVRRSPAAHWKPRAVPTGCWGFAARGQLGARSGAEHVLELTAAVP